MQDYGELNLAFEVLLVFAAALLDRSLVQASLRDSADRHQMPSSVVPEALQDPQGALQYASEPDIIAEDCEERAL